MGRTTIDGVAKDGIGVKVKARVTVRSNLDRFVGGATEETIIARVGEGIVSSIGSADSYKDVLENPDRISKTVLAKGLDSGTAFEILSIDIADVDVGENIGAKLQAEQADADKRVAQAKAEVRRAAAVAVEQEMRARTQEMRAKVVEAEAQVPQAMADAFRSGNLGIMDYLRMKNVQADTSMRESIAGGRQDHAGGRASLSIIWVCKANTMEQSSSSSSWGSSASCAGSRRWPRKSATPRRKSAEQTPPGETSRPARAGPNRGGTHSPIHRGARMPTAGGSTAAANASRRQVTAAQTEAKVRPIDPRRSTRSPMPAPATGCHRRCAALPLPTLREAAPVPRVPPRP